MSSRKRLKIALVGNPNSGKSSLFNCLTGLNQKVGNFPGVTVEKRVGYCTLPDGRNAEIVDLPGVYSIYPRSLDERIVSQVLLDHRSPGTPDVVVVVADATNLKRSLLLLTQVIDLGLPAILVLNMMDLAARAGISIDIGLLSSKLGVPVLPANARRGTGLNELQTLLTQPVHAHESPIFPIRDAVRAPEKALRGTRGVENDDEAYLFLEQPESLVFLSPPDRGKVSAIRTKHDFFPGKFQGAETIQRFGYIQNLLNAVTLNPADDAWKHQSRAIDRILTHRIWGYVIFFAI